MTQARLGDLMILVMHTDRTRTLDLPTIAEKFWKLLTRRCRLHAAVLL